MVAQLGDAVDATIPLLQGYFSSTIQRGTVSAGRAAFRWGSGAEHELAFVLNAFCHLHSRERALA